jgi:hypothetical protein
MTRGRRIHLFHKLIQELAWKYTYSSSPYGRHTAGPPARRSAGMGDRRRRPVIVPTPVGATQIPLNLCHGWPMVDFSGAKEAKVGC